MINPTHFQRISPQQCKKLHNASLEILERTGVRLFEPEAVELLKKARYRNQYHPLLEKPPPHIINLEDFGLIFKSGDGIVV